jgi:uncharacterized protein (TIGR00369 family)
VSEPSPGAADFDPSRLFGERRAGHVGTLGMVYRGHGPDWAELELPYDPALIGDVERGVLASGPILALMDMATGMSVWLKRGGFVPQATLDLRIDYLRPATPGLSVIGRGECYRMTQSIAFVRGQAHDGDPARPLAHVAGTFMLIGAQS